MSKNVKVRLTSDASNIEGTYHGSKGDTGSISKTDSKRLHKTHVYVEFIPKGRKRPVFISTTKLREI